LCSCAIAFGRRKVRFDVDELAFGAKPIEPAGDAAGFDRLRGVSKPPPGP
jgi:hypothetical protein